MAISWRFIIDFVYGHLGVSCKSKESVQAPSSSTVKWLDDSDHEVEYDLEFFDSIACLRKLDKGSRGIVKGRLKSQYECWESVLGN